MSKAQSQACWWKEAIFYQIYPRSFMDSNNDGIGDLPGVLSKLDYPKNLGVDVIWISPIYKSPNDDNGYDISDYCDIAAEFGDMRSFDLLLEEAHKRDMKIIMDLVLNHTSDEHPWFIESRSSKDNSKRDYYIWRDGKEGREPNNWESIFNGSAWEYDKASGQYYLHLFSKKQPDLNMENPDVRMELIRMMRWWLDKGIGGFRVDAITHIKKLPGLPDLPNPENKRYVRSHSAHMNITGIHRFLQEFKDEAFSKYDIVTVGEANGVPIEEANLWVGEEAGAFNMIFHFEHMDLDFGRDGRWGYGPWSLDDLKQITTKWQVGLESSGWNALYMENHDQPRSVSRFGDTEKFHKESSKLLATFFMLLKGSPFIYQGQEIGMTNISFESISDYKDVEIHNYHRERSIDGYAIEDTMRRIRYRARDNARTPMQWDATPNAGFSQGDPWIKVNPNCKAINVEDQLADENSILHYYKSLIRLRKSHPALVYGAYSLLLEYHPQIYAYTRKLNSVTFVVILNFSDQRPICSLLSLTPYKEKKLVLSNYTHASDNSDIFTMSPYEARVYQLTE